MRNLKKLLFTFLLLMQGCNSASNEVSDSANAQLDRDEAFVIAQDAASKHGYDLKKYALNTFGTEISEVNNEWMFVFDCAPAPSPQGCSFMVTVHRESGAAVVSPGL